jgi:ubiquinone/menaquinone biosynthesis C-methylase UbiE
MAIIQIRKNESLKKTHPHINEAAAALAFHTQSKYFDELYASNEIIQYKRNRVRAHLKTVLAPESFILELNSGTGEDAIWLATQGHRVHATDIAQGMQEKLKEKLTVMPIRMPSSTETLSFTQLDKLQGKMVFDAIFSNFAGLNCTQELTKVLHSFNMILKPGGIVTLVILPKFCLWELLLLFKGKWKEAFRRWSGRNGADAQIDGHAFKCWYYNPAFITKQLKKNTAA